MNLKAFINNISFPKTFEQLVNTNWKKHTDIENILNLKNQRGSVTWTVDKLAKKHDIIFFYHGKNSIADMRRILKNLDKKNTKYKFYSNLLERSIKTHKKYGGKIFAVGKMKNSAEISEFVPDLHFKKRTRGDIYKIFKLKNPIETKEFPAGLFIKKGSETTLVAGERFENLKKIIIKNNIVPQWFEEATSLNFDGKKINKNNFLKVIKTQKVIFKTEAEFRDYFVNYLLPYLSENIYTECTCRKKEINHVNSGIIDNIITLKDKNILIEIKLSKDIEKNFEKQLKKYIYSDYCINSEGKKIENLISDKIIVIDTEKIYMYEYNKKIENFSIIEIEKIENLKDLKSIELLKKKLIKKIF